MNILFLGGDKRYKYMMSDLAESSEIYQVGFDFNIPNVYKVSLETVDLSKFDIILFPISGINDKMEIKTEKGIIVLPEKIFKKLNKETLVFTGLKTEKLLKLIPEKQIISFLDNEEVKNTNDDLTVDGTIDDIRDRKNDTVCILGYGKLGKKLYLRLRAIGIKVYVISRPKELIYTDNVENYSPLNSQNIIDVFKKCNIVINTIPLNIIPEEAIKADYVPYILDIASYPYGIDQEIVKKYKEHIKYNLYLGIPSKFAPKEASEILVKTLKEVTHLK